MQPAIFLDRDGVLNTNRTDYVKSWEEFEWLPNSLEALRLLRKLGRPTVVVTNQSAIGRGIIDRKEVDHIHKLMRERAERVGGRIDKVIYCPHHPDDNCSCRKPRPGMILQASSQLGLNLHRSYLIGDSLTDVLAAQAAGCLPILVQTGRGREQLQQLKSQGVRGFYVTADLLDAVRWIIKLENLNITLLSTHSVLSKGAFANV